MQKITQLSLIVTSLSFLFASSILAAPEIAHEDRVRLIEATRLAESVRDKVWRGWSEAPFAILLIGADYEYLLRHPAPPEDFQKAGDDPIMKTRVYYRKKTYAATMQATFPIGGIPTIVIGAETKNSTQWVLTALHEHFHQFQYSQPGYYDAVKSLNLSGGDETGMWMLNYPFPYKDDRVNAAFADLAAAAIAFLQSEKKNHKELISNYIEHRSRLKNLLTADQHKYMEFQLWQEGASRYVQWSVAATAADAEYPSLVDFLKLPGAVSYETAAEKMIADLISELANLKLKEAERVAFYPLGAVECLMLDETQPDWKNHYFSPPLYLALHP